jgi:hypothetical protein
MQFFLGSHRPSWLAMQGPALMVSLNTMPRYRFPRAIVPWMLDSGGFTELQQHGRWRTSAEQHAERVAYVADQVGTMITASPQDWMVEPAVLAGGKFAGLRFAGTGLSVREHQCRTVENLLELRRIAPRQPWMPVLQGWTVNDYHRCVDDYTAAGVDLAAEPVVGVGSVCRRQGTDEAADIMRTLHDRGIRLHGFGLSARGIARLWPWLHSADSMAWSATARRNRITCGRPNGRGGTVVSCGNCRHFAVEWADAVLAERRPVQLSWWVSP